MTTTTTDAGHVAKRLQQFYQQFSASSIAELGQVYHPQVVFVDPIHQVEGLSSLQRYFENILHGVDYCHFEFTHSALADAQLFLAWTMRFRHPNLGKGREIVVPGVSHCQIAEDRIIYQRDFYDAGAMVYEHVPVLAYVIGKVKQRLHSA